jgi:hypothetical protein
MMSKMVARAIYELMIKNNLMTPREM